jgi:hypothetical protein
MTSTGVRHGPAWIRVTDELLHQPDDIPNWAENYLGYVYSPGSEVGLWLHMTRVPSEGEGLWSDELLAALPGDMFLVSKAFGKGGVDGAVSGSALSFHFDDPFARWRTGFHGAARLVSGAELRSGPVIDGPYVPVDIDLTCTAMSPPYDYGAPKVDQAWGTGRYEQAQAVRGTMTYGEAEVEILGTGLRDHSWGPRDNGRIGTTSWIHGQFPRSGRWFMANYNSRVPPAQPFSYAVAGNNDAVVKVVVNGLPKATGGAETVSDYEFELVTPDGTTPIRAEIVQQPVTLALLGPVQFGFGIHRTPGAHHDYVPAFTRFTWDGEVGYGLSCRSVDLGRAR